MNRLSVVLLIVVAGYLIVACTQPATLPATSPAREVSPAPKAGWEQKWEATLEAARKEGNVLVYATWSPDVRMALSQAFKNKFGITLEFSPFNRGAEILAKVQAEKNAGLYLADAFGTGGPSLLTILKPESTLGTFDPLLILPEVVDPNAWRGGKVPFLDKDHMAVGLVSALNPYILYNTELIKTAELAKYEDLLRPQYKGKITLNDPTVTGSGNAFVSHLAYDIWNMEKAVDFLRQLKKQEPVITRDGRQHIEWVARAKYPIGLGPNTEAAIQFLNLGAPISVVKPPEGTLVSPGAGCLGVPAKFHHPNAAAVFVNWLLTKEGQTAFVKGFNSPSFRVDVPVENIPAVYNPQPGEKLYFDSEDFVTFRGKMLEVAKSILEEPSK